jgi:hypothetical protein
MHTDRKPTSHWNSKKKIITPYRCFVILPNFGKRGDRFVGWIDFITPFFKRKYLNLGNHAISYTQAVQRVADHSPAR